MDHLRRLVRSEPIVFIRHGRVKEGKLDAPRDYYRQVAEMTETRNRARSPTWPTSMRRRPR
jgi:hypothetical protein